MCRDKLIRDQHTISFQGIGFRRFLVGLIAQVVLVCQPTLLRAQGEIGVGLFLAYPDGSNLRCVAPPADFARAAMPAWSPDSRSIAFVAFDATGREPRIRTVSIAGGPALDVGAGIAPSWSADGRRIAYVASGRPPFATDWTRPGQNNERIEVVTITDGKPGAPEVVGPGLWPRWSPTDDRLAYAARREGTWDIYIRAADGLGLLRLTDDPALDTFPLWSADGQSISFLSNRANRWDFFTIPADRSGAVLPLKIHPRREEWASLGPDGKLLVMTESGNRRDSQLLIVDVATKAARPMFPTREGDRDPAWSPDGRWIAFVSRRPSLPMQ